MTSAQPKGTPYFSLTTKGGLWQEPFPPTPQLFDPRTGLIFLMVGLGFFWGVPHGPTMGIGLPHLRQNHRKIEATNVRQLLTD